MTVIRSGRLVRLAGAACLVGGGLAAAAVVLFAPFAGCTDVGVPPDADTGFEFRGVDDGAVVYSPDGVNECRTPVATVAVPTGLVVVGAALARVGRPARRDGDVPPD